MQFLLCQKPRIKKNTLLHIIYQSLKTAKIITLPYQVTHTHTRLTALFPGLPGWVGTRKVKPIWILRKKETVSGSGISWAICKSAPCSRQVTTPAPHHSFFLQAGCPYCCPTNSVKALKATALKATLSSNTHTQSLNRNLSGSTWVGRYQKKHTPTHTHPDQRASFFTFLHLQWSMASSLFNLRA